MEDLFGDISSGGRLEEQAPALSGKEEKRLRSADRSGTKILVVHGKNALDAQTREMLSTPENLRLLYAESPRAKCYFNERQLALSTMNLYAFSERNNREMGIRAERTGEAASIATFSKRFAPSPKMRRDRPSDQVDLGLEVLADRADVPFGDRPLAIALWR